MTDQTTLDAAFTKQGIEHVSFWNGRVLTGEDLRDEQNANARSRRRLGRAVGAGIASGLMVTRGSLGTQVLVTAGVAVNHAGQALELPVDVDVSLVVPPSTAALGDSDFIVCPDVPSEVPPATGTGSGVYLLVMRPAAEDKDEAAGVPYNGDGVASVCGPRYSIDGVSFRLVGLDTIGLATAAGHDAADLATLASLEAPAPDDDARNVLSHLFLDTAGRREVVLDPFGAGASAAYGAIDALRADGTLEDCDVPLGLVLWTAGAVAYAESWAVRRPLAAAHAAASALEGLGSGRPVAEGAAAYFQFQHQLAGLASTLTAAERAGLRASERFRYLPAAGFVRLGSGGFGEGQFFDGITTKAAVPISDAQVVPLLDASFRYPPIDLTTGEVVNLYHVRGADDTSPVDDAASPPPAYVLFSSSQIPYLGDELAIDAVFPPGTLHLAQQIEIRGRGFGFSTGAARIRFALAAGGPVLTANALPGSSDTKLLTVVPPTLVVEEGGTDVIIRVTNNELEDSVPVVVAPQVVDLAGDIDVTFVSVAPENIPSGQPATFRYTIESRLNRTADITVTAEVTSASFPPAVSVQDDTGSPLPEDILTLEPDAAASVFVVVDPIEDVPSITITLDVVAGPVDSGSIDTFTVGTAPPEQDPNIPAIRVNSVRLQGSDEDLDFTPIRLAPGTIANVDLSVDITAAGTYDVTLELDPDDGSWIAGIGNPPDAELRVTEDEIETGGGTEIKGVLFAVGPTAGAGPGSINVVVQEQSSALDRRRMFALEVG